MTTEARHDYQDHHEQQQQQQQHSSRKTISSIKSTSSKRAEEFSKAAKIDRHVYYDPYPVVSHKGEHFVADAFGEQHSSAANHHHHHSLSGKYTHAHTLAAKQSIVCC